MKILLLLLMSTNIINAQTLIYDFLTPETSGKWYIVNDGVMGGVSNSEITFNDDNTLTFSGNLSPDNYGGFASIRSFIKPDTDQEFNGVIIRMKGDGNTYSLRFRTNNSFDSYAHQGKVSTIKDEWQEFKIAFNEFEATYRGRKLRNKEALSSKNIAQIGIMVADKQFGAFTTDIDWITFY